jgi:hypothetical protein
MTERNEADKSWLMNPTLLLTHLLSSLVNNADGFRVQCFGGGVRIDQSHAGEWRLVDTITLNSERIHQAYDIARYFGWDDFKKQEEVLATAWNHVKLGPEHTICKVWLRKNQGKYPEITIWH